MTTLTHGGQLAFEFQISPVKEKAYEDKQSFQFYPADSTILKNIFSLKINYNGRSYILKGKYRIATIRAYGDLEDKVNTVGFVELEKILAYKGFMYSRAFMSKPEVLRLRKLAEKILSNPEYNQNLETY